MMNTELKTKPTLKLAPSHQSLLACPICQSELKPSDFQSNHLQLQCTNSQCQAVFPIVDEVPILINDSSSVFAIDDFLDSGMTRLKPKAKLERMLINLVPGITLNLKAKTNYQKLTELLLAQNSHPNVLVIGGSIEGQGMEPLRAASSIDLVEIDVAFGPRVSVIGDAHDLPFQDNSFDGVVIQAVLEHVADPTRCVEEIHRVLKKGGLVYAETPFIAQVHLGKYDFTRFTHLGHRRLFRRFEEIASGAVCGPGSALAWSYQYFLLSFVQSSVARAVVKVFARFTAFWLTYFDYYLIDKPGTYDSALGYYFIGQKSDQVLSDRELLNGYRGTQYSSF
jgi:SAM-dependent methyltransferase